MKTIATFGDSIGANLARARLEDAGISVYLADEEIVSQAWYLTTAFGGIKLQVADEDAEQASTILAERGEDPTAPEAVTEAVTEAESPSVDDLVSEPVLDYAGGVDESDDADITLTPREQTADRALRGAVLSIFLFPLQVFVFYLLIKVFISEDYLRQPHRRRAIIAAFINLPCMLVILMIVKGWLGF